jgi:conserved domain protein
MSNKSTENKEIDDKECFVIMPISDDPSHPEGHFLRVYEDIIKPACENAGFIANRADDDNASNLIHLSILNKLIKAPIAICDLSTRNPNVLFELWIRQAFNKPVVLIQERGTPKIFDISPLRYLEYSNDLKYRDVIKAQEDIKNMIIETIGDKRA